MVLTANGDAISALRQAMGWKTVAFARAVGISHSYLSNIEAGRKPASPPVLRRIAHELRVPISAITNQMPQDETTAA